MSTSSRRPTRIPLPVAAAIPERTPGVSYEKSGFDFWLILRLGFGLIVTVVVLQLAVRWLLVHYEIPNAPPLSGESSLGLDDARRPLGQRLLDVPPPHLEGIERESSLLILRTGESEQQRFYVAPNIHVSIKGKARSPLRAAGGTGGDHHLPHARRGGRWIGRGDVRPQSANESRDRDCSRTSRRHADADSDRCQG